MRPGSCSWEDKADPASAALTSSARGAWNLFGLSQSQWNVGMSGATGMRYEGVESCARLHGIEITPRVFHLFQMIEAKRLRIWADEAAERAKEAERKAKR